MHFWAFFTLCNHFSMHFRIFLQFCQTLIQRTVGIWFMSRIQMVNMFSIAEWSVNRMVTWIVIQDSSVWSMSHTVDTTEMWAGSLFTSHLFCVVLLLGNNRHLLTIRPFSYRTFCPLFRSPFGSQTKTLLTEWSRRNSDSWMFPVTYGPVIECLLYFNLDQTCSTIMRI